VDNIDLCLPLIAAYFLVRGNTSASSSVRQFFKRSAFLMVATAKLRVPRTWNQSSGNDWILLRFRVEPPLTFSLSGWVFIVPVKELCVQF